MELFDAESGALAGVGRGLLDGVVGWLHEGVVIQDAGGHIRSWNAAACELLGLDLGGPLDSTELLRTWDIVDERGRHLELSAHPAGRVLRTGAAQDGRLGILRPDGGRRWLRASSAPLVAGPDGRARPAEGLVPLDEVVGVISTLADVTEEVETTRRLRQSEARFRLTLENAPIGVALVGLDGTLVDVNPAFGAMLGREPEDLVGTTFQAITHPDDLDADLALLRQLVAGDIPRYAMEKRYFAIDGRIVWARLAVALVRDDEGRPVHFVSQVEDVTEVRRAKAQLEHRALFDSLTGLANRALLLDRLGQVLIHAERSGRATAVLFCDLDHFKRVNDSLGHAAGDVLLRQVGARMSAAVRQGDTVARLGGDEFVVVLDEVRDGDEAVEVAERLKEIIESPTTVLDRQVVPRVSIGICLPGPGAVAEEVLADADTALYAAKERGRSRWELYDRAMRADAQERITVESELRSAIGTDQLVLHYQPIVDMVSGERVAYEALVRWHHPTRGLLLPGAFVPVAEETRLVVPLGEQVLSLACDFLARHADVGRVFVNASAEQFRSATLAEVVRRELARHGVAPERLGLEITETSVLQAAGPALRQMEELAAAGVPLVLDDFGTGYSAVSSLLATPVAGLKLDRAFTARVGADAQADRLTRAIAGLVETLGCYGVVEGVETPEQRARVLAHGWRHGQGYLFGRPLPEEELGLDRG